MKAVRWSLALLLLSISLSFVHAQNGGGTGVKLDHKLSIIVAVLVIGAVLIFFAGLGYLWWRNRNRVAEVKVIKHRPWYIKWPLWFLKNVLIELIGLIFSIGGIVGMETADWEGFDIKKIKIAYYIFFALKFILIVSMIVIELWFEEVIQKVAVKLRIRQDWPELLEGLIFVPAVLIDGIIMNAEFVVGLGNADFFKYDSIILMCVDSVLYIKLMVTLILRIHSFGEGKARYFYIDGVFYACMSLFYTLANIYFFMFMQLQNCFDTYSTNLNVNCILILVNIISHPIISSYTSMMRQGITANDRALKGTDFRVKSLKFYLYYFRIHVIPIIMTIILYGFTYYIYAIVFYISIDFFVNRRPEPELKVGATCIVIILHILNAFFSLNLLYGTLKRLGGWFGLPKPIPDCSTYAMAVNTILVECNANFRMTNRMTVG